MDKRYYLQTLCACIGLLLLFGLVSEGQAETVRKRYRFPYDRATRSASELRAKSFARKKFLREFLAEKFSKDIVDNLAEDIDIALDPPEDYLVSFEVVSSRINDEETEVTVTVEGEVDLPGMITALVNNKVLSFGERPPKVMFLPSSRFESPKAAKTLRALLYDKLKQAGLQSVAFEGATETLSTQIKGKITPNSTEFRVLQKLVTQYNADYLVYVDTEADNRPASVGGYLCDANFIYTVMRPNNNIILGEGVVSDRASANSSMLAFDKTLDKVAPTLINQAVGQLFQSIYADSDVIYNTPQLRNTIQVTVYEAKSDQVQQIISALQAGGATVSLGSGTGISSRLNVDTSLDTLGLYNFFNKETFGSAVKFKTPVVGYSENTIDIEVTAVSKPPKRTAAIKPPAPKPRPKPSGEGDPPLIGERSPKEGDGSTLASRLKSRTKPAVTLQLKPVSLNK
ncbi:MAG: hypothetical protein AB1489_01045 [Acidobacteriota bacterium]